MPHANLRTAQMLPETWHAQGSSGIPLSRTADVRNMGTHVMRSALMWCKMLTAL